MMLGNFLALLLVIGLVVLFGRLTYRALRARKLWVKVLGGLAAGLMTLLLLALAFFGGKGLAGTYFPGAPPAPELTVAGSEEQIARGAYLVNVSCVGCHGAPNPDGSPSGEPPLAGGFNLSQFEGFGFIGDLIAENLTPGGKLADYGDGELFRAMRYNVNQEGHALGLMKYLPYAQLSDDDIEAVIAYLRSLPAVETPAATGDNLNFIGAVMLGAGMFGTPAEPGGDAIPHPVAGPTAEYGKYVATFGECRGCHGPDMTGSDATAVSEAVPDPRPLVSSLTQEEFVQMMRSGVRPGNSPFPAAMPWQNAAKMTDEDLAALYAYLTTAP